MQIRDLTEDEKAKFNINCNPSLQLTTKDWNKLSSDSEVYKVYLNDRKYEMLVLKYSPNLDRWIKIKVSDIKNMYILLYKLLSSGVTYIEE